MHPRAVSAAVAVTMFASVALFTPGAQASTTSMQPAACSTALVQQLPQISKFVSKAYDAFNIGSRAKTEPYMRQAIKSAKKALKGTSTQSTRALLTAFISIGADEMRVSSMSQSLVDLQDHVNAGC